MIKSAHKPFLVRPPLKLLSLLGTTSDCVVKFATYYPHYKKKFWIIKSTFNSFLFRLPPKLISPFRASSDYIVKIMKLSRCIPKAGKHLVAVHQPHYKEKLWKTSRLSCYHYPVPHLTALSNLLLIIRTIKKCFG